MTFLQMKAKHESIHKISLTNASFARKLIKIYLSGPLTKKMARDLGVAAAYLNEDAQCPIQDLELAIRWCSAYRREKAKIEDALVLGTVENWQKGDKYNQLVKKSGLSPKKFQEEWSKVQFLAQLYGQELPDVTKPYQIPTIGNQSDF